MIGKGKGTVNMCVFCVCVCVWGGMLCLSVHTYALVHLQHIHPFKVSGHLKII